MKPAFLSTFLLAGLLAAQPRGVDILMRGLQALSDGHFSDAETCLRQAVALQPKSFDARFALGAALAQLKYHNEAIEHLEEAHRLQPSHAGALKLLAGQYMAARNHRKAIALLAPVVAPDEESSLLLMEAYQTVGEPARSFTLAQKAGASWTSSAPMHCWLAFHLTLAARYTEAHRHLDESIRLAPDYPAGHYLLGALRLKEAKPREAVPHFEKAVELNPEDVDARLGLAMAQADAGAIAQGIWSLQEAALSSPEDGRVQHALARLCARSGDQPCARQAAELAEQLSGAATGTGGAPPISLRTVR